MRKVLSCISSVALLVVGAGIAGAGEVDAQSAFDRLKGLAGTWRGAPEGHGEAEAEAGAMDGAVHEIRVSAAGTVVMETMFPGTDHEMINMYHLDGDDLVLTHYCAEGNQPEMRLDRAGSTRDSFVFAFAGGTNFDPAVDKHIHSALIELQDDGTLVSTWRPYDGGEQVGVMSLHLTRKR